MTKKNNKHFFIEDNITAMKDIQETWLQKLITKFKRRLKMITRKSFLSGKGQTRYDNLKIHPVTMFLERNRSTAFTAKEIAQEINMNENTVRGALIKLQKRKKVIHKQPHFSIK